MKKIIATGAASAMLATTAIAGNLDPMVIGAVPVISQASGPNWGGFYGGLEGAAATADASFLLNGSLENGPFDADGALYGGFAGYNFQNGNFVYGGELSYMFGNVEEETNIYDYNSVVDIKARAGFAFGSALAYAAVGYSSANLSEDYAEPESNQLGGFGYGAGVDLMVSEKIFVGVEYYTRVLSGSLTYPTATGWTADGSLTTITARAGVKF